MTSKTPMLVWQGKEALDETDVEADAPPIYIQEKVDPRVLVENLRKTAKANEPEPELTLFDTFDGLDGLDLVEFYEHESNWSNRMILGDSLQVMASLDSRERLRGKVQMIYVDPPYGIKFGSNWQVSARKRDVKDGKVEDIAREVEQIKAFRDTWELGHQQLPHVPARPAAGGEGAADRERQHLRPDRRRERPPRSQPAGRSVRGRELRQLRSRSKTDGAAARRRTTARWRRTTTSSGSRGTSDR